jgi:hypothetical protein
MAPAPALPELIATVEADTDGLEPLAHLAAASAIAAELTESADALIGHFVDRCRATGRTWSEISVALGVTKQAAHKRYSAVPNPNLMGRFTDRARQTISEAFLAARELGHPFVGTEHVLLGLFPPGGLAATLLTESGLTKAKVTEQVLTYAPRGVATDAGDPAPPYTPRAAQVFSTALSEALTMGHNYIGTEHLVLALFHDPEGVAAKVLAGAGATHADYKAKIVKLLVGFAKA